MNKKIDHRVALSPSSSTLYHRQYRDDNRELRRKWNREWIASNRERYNASKYLYRERLKLTVMEHYGGGRVECVGCGFTNINALCLDHINDDGAEQRKLLGIAGRNSAGTNTYEALRKAGLPEGIQILCANCNLIKEQQRKRELRLKNHHYAERYSSV